MPASPQETLRELAELFPGFEEAWSEEGAPARDGLVDGVYYEWRHHAVLARFLVFFARNHTDFTQEQVHRLGDWLNQAVVEGGALENAVSTCFLEHMRHVKIDRIMAPHLSSIARARSHA